ncbi:MAG: hypothetical protein Q9209_003634 [Squamulea sp. 1 TL-2023]
MEQTQSKPFPLLMLTRELRDNIYDTLLLSSRAAPSSPKNSGLRKRPGEDDQECFESCNLYQADNLESSTSSLQLTSRQVYNEVTEAIARLQRLTKLPYKLDCMLVDEVELLPTWLSFPAFVSEIPKLEVDFRLFGDVEGKQSAWTGGCGGPPVMVWCLFYLMKRFLLRGPDFLSMVKQTKRIMVNELSINVLTPALILPNGFIVEKYGPFIRGRRKGLMSPETLLSLMADMMGYLLGRSRYTASYATLVFERVQRITFHLDGKERRKWDLRTMRLVCFSIAYALNSHV